MSANNINQAGQPLPGADWAADMRAKLDEAIAAAPAAPAAPVANGDHVRELASALLGELEGLIDESTGVYGLHLNGDPSPWGELVEGGRFERLSSMDALRSALASAQPSREPLAAKVFCDEAKARDTNQASAQTFAAGALFRVYEQSHRAKGPGHEGKVERNAEIAGRIEAAVTPNSKAQGRA